MDPNDPNQTAPAGDSSGQPAPTQPQADTSATQSRISDLEGRRTQLISQLQDPATGTTQKQQINSNIRSLETELSRAYRDLAATTRTNAEIASKQALASGGTQALAAYTRAQADQARADAYETRANAYAETTGAKRDQLEADTKLKTAQADKAQAEADLAGATSDIQKQAAQTALDAANANLQVLQSKAANAPAQDAAATQTAQANAATASANASVAPQIAGSKASQEQSAATTAAAGASVAPQVATDKASEEHSTATTAAAGASVAPQMAQAQLDKAQSDADKARLDVQNTQAQLNATTDDDRRRAIQLDLNQKQAVLDTANANLDQAKKLMPIAVDQANANVGATQASTAKTAADVEAAKQGTLYGAQDRIQSIRQLIASGQKTPQEADQMIQDYIQSQINQATSGATEFERNKAAVDAETTRRGQDSSLAGNLAGDFTSGFGNSLSTFGKLNDTIQPGSDAGGRGFLASLDLLGNKLGQFQGSVAPAASPLINSLRGPVAPAPLPVAAPAPVASATAAPTSTGHQITINIGGSGDGGSSQPTPPMFTPPAAPAPTPAPAPVAPNPTADSIAAAFQANGGQFASSGTPPMFSPPPLATHDDVNALWQDDPNLNPPSPAGQDDSSNQGQ